MPLDLSQSATTPNIEDEVKAAELGVVELLEIDFGLSFKKFWSTIHVPIEFVATQFGTTFEARVESIGDRTWSTGLDDDTVNLVISDADGEVSRIAKERGIDVFEGAKVRMHRLFSSVKEIYKNYWVGEGLPPVFTEGQISWDISFGIGNFRQKFGRLAEFTCHSVFAGGPSSNCPYEPSIAIGVPEAKLLATAASGTNNRILNVSGGGLSAMSVGWLVYNRTNNTYARIVSIASDTQLNIVVIATGEGGTAIFASGHNVLIGPPFTSCGKNPPECKAREMFGKHKENPNGAGDKRRYYAGDAEAANIRFSGRLPNPGQKFGHSSADRFTRTTLGNRNLSGSVIPVIFGFYRINDIPSIYMGPAGAFQHGLFVLCEGEINNFNVLSVNGHAVDNNPRFGDEDDRIQHDSYIKWGTWYRNGIEDSRATTIGRARQIREAIGRRRSYGMADGTVFDTYGTGAGGIGHPWLFNDKFGGGTSQHGLVVARIRIETQEDIQNTLTGDFDIVGLMTPLATGMPNNLEDRSDYNLVVGGTTLRYTSSPNPIQVAYTVLRNTRWGAGIPESKFNLDSVISTSAFCESRIEGVENAGRIVRGDVDVSSEEMIGLPNDVWVFVEDIREATGSMVGRIITFNKTNSKAFTAIVVRNQFFESITEQDICDDDPGICTESGVPYFDVSADLRQAGNLIKIDRAFPSGKTPVSGDNVEIVGGRFTTRFKANGVLADNVPITDIVQDILQNCNGDFRSNGEEIEFFIRKKLSAAEIDTVISDGIFTDRGVQRNILRVNGKSTMRVWREDEKTLGNYFTVEFRDRERDFQDSRVAVANDSAQRRAAKLFNELEGRTKIPESEDLIMTTSRDQAARLLALKARELFIQNLFCEFQTSLKRGMKALPGDIIAVDSNTIASHFNIQLLANDIAIGNSFLFRILEKNESSSYTTSFKCQVHVNPIYEDFATDFTQFFFPDELRRTIDGVAATVQPLTPTERVVIGPDEIRSLIKVKVTYPNMSS